MRMRADRMERRQGRSDWFGQVAVEMMGRVRFFQKDSPMDWMWATQDRQDSKIIQYFWIK